GEGRWGERGEVVGGGVSVSAVTVIGYAIALKFPQPIFDLAVQYAFSGYSAMMPLLVGALFWKRSTKWGALASALWATASVVAVAVFQSVVKTPKVVWSIGGVEALARTPAGTAVFGLLPVAPMVIISSLLMIVVSLATKRPSEKAVSRYFLR